MNKPYMKSNYTQRLLYIMIIIVLVFAGVFLGIYLLWARFWPAIIIHSLYIGLHFSLLPLVAREQYLIVRFTILFSFIIQLTLAVFLWFPLETNYSLFYFLVPIGAFAMIDILNPIEKWTGIGVSILSIFFYFMSTFFRINFDLYAMNGEAINIISGLSLISTISIASFLFYIHAMSLARKSYELEYLANTDSLTKSANRRKFFSQAEMEFDLASKYGYSFTLIILDIDHFKNINDRYGHAVGDQVLVEFSEKVRKTIRVGDMFGRYGGEEFGIIIRKTNRETALDIAQKLRKSVEGMRFEANGNSFGITVSIGAVQFSEVYEAFDEMMVACDKALYEAKDSGRNKVVYTVDR